MFLGGPYTLWAPTDEAFDRIPRETLSKVLQNTSIIKTILQRHIIPNKVLHVKGISWDVHDTLGTVTRSLRILTELNVNRWNSDDKNS